MSLEELEALWQEVQSLLHQTTPEARLNLLLDSSKEYCSDEEFAEARAEALRILAHSVFREAREFAVKLHNDLRARAKSTERNQDKDTKEQANDLSSSPKRATG